MKNMQVLASKEEGHGLATNGTMHFPDKHREVTGPQPTFAGMMTLRQQHH